MKTLIHNEDFMIKTVITLFVDFKFKINQLFCIVLTFTDMKNTA